MPKFFAATSRGLSDVLEKELVELGVKPTKKVAAGVFFEGNWEDSYRVNLCSRIASRVTKPVLDFPAYQPEELYYNISKHDFTKYIDPEQTITVDASVKECKIRDQRMVAMKVKDAIVDEFTDKFGRRPDVDNRNAELRVNVAGYKNFWAVGIDTSGESLFKRGYRLEAGEAPLKENLAAGLIALSEWDRQSPIVDPMCGSGTFLIEAAMMALKMAPGMQRRRFGFENLHGFDSDAWDRVVEQSSEGELETLPFKFYGYDIDKKVLAKAKDNARRAGVDHVIEFRYSPITTLNAPTTEEGAVKGMVVVNPPYGARIGDEDNLKDVYRDLAHTLKTNFKGWNAWVLSGNRDLIGEMKLKSTRKFQVFNGPLECRFLKYEMF